MDINLRTVKNVIKRQYNIIIDEEKRLKQTLAMETSSTSPEYDYSGLHTRVEKHLEIIINAQNRIVLLQQKVGINIAITTTGYLVKKKLKN